MIKKVFAGMRRSPYQTAAAVMIIFISFFVAAVYFLSAMTAQRVLTELSGRPQVIVFIKDEAKEDEVNKLKSDLNNNFKLKDLKYLSKDDALNRYKDQNKDDPLLLELVNAQILPASLEVSAVNAADLAQIFETAKTNPAVEDAVYQKEEIKDLLKWVESIRLSGIILVGLLLLESLLVLLIIFALKITIRKDEIEVVKLVGATSGQTRGPFLAEGALYGFFAGFSSFILTYLFVVVWKINPLGIIPALANYTVPFALTPVNVVIWGLVQTTLAILIGLSGSYLAVWRYLKN
jgi:cell division transport system permease protein